ncbi:hypothetical protein NKW54_08495 [Acetobacter cerevisiae]|uniref:Uncharacterized protein n=1 Tax=Acetobacter cerevisiae TaxID=178900 RepID=A0ABT1ERG5_9PROT|nr:hypothetical protein [Acetobacter cerevisiae]MCP1245977.1 hypothetical protein [Acetobacter cerevisiae]MCP1255695.1 hypothetical protein [Acetobacter cerevisiae]
MSDDTQPKQVAKATKTVAVITLLPVYTAAGRAPYPIGTKLNVAPDRASFWVSRGIARLESAGAGEVNRVGPSADNSVEVAPLPDAPPMTPLPQNLGS